MWQIIGGIACISLALPCGLLAIVCAWNWVGMMFDTGGDALGLGAMFTTIAGIGATVSGIATGALVWLAWMLLALPAPQTWDEWLAIHKQTCPECQRAFDEADGAMCVEAFERFKAELK